MLSINLISGRLMLAPQFTGAHKDFGPSSLRVLHKSLNVEDRVAALIRKHRLLTYPEGTSLAGMQIY